MSTISFREKVVWITGASSGIGEALAVAFAGKGARLVLSARDTNGLERAADRCQAAGAAARPVIVPFDMEDHRRFPDITRSVLERNDRIDILVNNAGVGQRSTALSCNPDVVRRIMDVNFFGPVFLTQSLLPSMIERGSGRIVVVSSVLGKFHLPGRSAYGASKHALQGYFATLRSELYGSGIGITVICPGWIATGISKNALTASGDPAQTNSTRNTRMSAESFARAALKAIAGEKNEVVIGGVELLGIWAVFFAPKLFDRIIRRHGEFSFTPREKLR